MASETTRTILTVPGISCAHCERAVTEALTPVPGVRGVAVDIPRHEVTVDYDGASVDVARLEAVLAEEDYPVSGSRAG